MAQATKRNLIGKLLLTLGTAIYTFIPPLVDLLTHTHIFNPDWVPHARFHTMWAILSASTMGLIAIWMTWRGPADGRAGVLTAGLISTGVLGAFMVAAMSMPLYGGALSDPGGVEPLANGVDGNLMTFAVAIIMVLAGWRLASLEER